MFGLRDNLFEVPNEYRTYEEARCAAVGFLHRLERAFGEGEMVNKEHGGINIRYGFNEACVCLDFEVDKRLETIYDEPMDRMDTEDVYFLRCDLYVETEYDPCHDLAVCLGSCTFNDEAYKDSDKPWKSDFEFIKSAFDIAKQVGK